MKIILEFRQTCKRCLEVKLILDVMIKLVYLLMLY